MGRRLLEARQSLPLKTSCVLRDTDHPLPPELQIHEMHQRKEVPIVVGGTSYWIQHLIFPNRLSKQSEAPPSSDRPWDPALLASINALPDHLRGLFDDLPSDPPNAKTDPEAAFKLHALLLLLDPPVGQRWHWKDTRKVLHSLSIIQKSRRRASDIIAEQAASHSDSSSASSQPRCDAALPLQHTHLAEPCFAGSRLCASGCSLNRRIWNQDSTRG